MINKIKILNILFQSTTSQQETLLGKVDTQTSSLTLILEVFILIKPICLVRFRLIRDLLLNEHLRSF
jgi:hypothetical protein